METLYRLREQALREGLRDRVCPGPMDADALLAELAAVRRALPDDPCPARIDGASHAAMSGSERGCRYCGVRVA